MEKPSDRHQSSDITLNNICSSDNNHEEGQDKNNRTSLRHVIPYVGVTEIVLHPPAAKVYKWLESQGEVDRLSHLQHLGALSVTFPGARHARW